MAEGFLAKSFYPSSFLNASNMEYVGGRQYTFNENSKDGQDNTNTELISKLYFMKTNDNGIEELALNLKEDKFIDNQSWQNNSKSIETIDLLRKDEKIQGFEQIWEYGRVELVFHPFDNCEKQLRDKLNKIIGAPINDKIKIKAYKDGPVFMSAFLNKGDLEKIANLNPLRSMHPMRKINIPELRNYMQMEAPQPPSSNQVSNIKIGIFDGGVDSSIPMLHRYTVEHNPILSPKADNYIAHGSAVCGLALHGPLNSMNKNTILPVPNVSVESFRVLPTTDPNDMDLYEVIDIIEDIVPKRKDIKVYNLSLGPAGAIVDDNIDRFTYALDKLSFDEDVLFVIAAGNDGELSYPLNRIQSPADLVNGLGVGAFTFDNGKIVHAPYSCTGPGREGCKIKPDVVAFGGCGNNPIHVVSISPNKKIPSAGTSFSSPIAANTSGQLMGTCMDVNSLIARALMIHTASYPDSIPDLNLGHGYINTNVNDILECTQNKVNILYSGHVKGTQGVKLPILIPDIGDYKGNVIISWTIAVLTRINALDSDNYTNNCIEDTFYPNANKYKLNHELSKPKSVTVNTKINKELIQNLISKGYKMSGTPISKSGNKYKTEEDRRKDFKWDTIVKRWVVAKYNNIESPYIAMHAMGRNGYEKGLVKYAVVVSIEIPQYKGNLYDEIVRTYNRLEPVRLRNRNEIMITI